MTRASLEAAVPPGRSILADTSVVLAYLNGSEVASEAETVECSRFAWVMNLICFSVLCAAPDISFIVRACSLMARVI